VAAGGGRDEGFLGIDGAGSDNGTGTDKGEEEAGTSSPPSKRQRCARL
jgi:hypothetical protein